MLLYPSMPDLQTDTEAQITVRDMLCSICWKHLTIHHAPDRMNLVLCCHCGKLTKGYVSKAWVEHRRAESLSELLEVERFYPELAGKKKSSQTADDINHDLGF